MHSLTGASDDVPADPSAAVEVLPSAGVAGVGRSAVVACRADGVSRDLEQDRTGDAHRTRRRAGPEAAWQAVPAQRPTAPTSAAVDVWLLDVGEDRAGETCDWLSTEERARASAFRRDVDRHSFVAGARLVRAVAASRLGISPRDVGVVRTCVECGGPHGPIRVPSVTAPPLHLSLSRAGQLIAVALNHAHRVGVDIELTQGNWDLAEVDGAFDAEELRVLRALGPSSRAGRVAAWWTRKEAVSKALELGLRLDLRLVRASDAPGPVHVLEPGVADAIVHVVDFETPTGHAGAVAVRADEVPQLRIHRGEALVATPASP